MKLFHIFLFLIILLSSLPHAQAVEGHILRVAFDKNLPPFSSVDAEGNPTGFNIDLIRDIAVFLGYEVAYYPLEWEEATKKLKSGAVDVVLGMTYSSSRDQEFDFSESYFTMSEVLIVPKNDSAIFGLNDLKNKVVAVQNGKDEMDLLQSVRRVKMLVAFSQPDALEMLFIGRADAFIGNRWTAEHILQKTNNQKAYVTRVNMMNPSDYAFVVQEGNYELLQELNRGLNELHSNGTYQKLYSHYFEQYSLYATTWWRKLVIVLLLSIVIGFIILGFSFFWNIRLKQLVKKQTAVLANTLSFQGKVLENVNNGIVSFNEQGEITLINQVATELLDGKKEALGANISEYSYKLPITSILGTEQWQTQQDEIHLGDGSGRIIYYYIAPLYSGDGKYAGGIVCLQDRTEQKHLLARLLAQEKMRAIGQLVAGIAHELRNPLTAIKTFTELLPKKLDDTRFRKEFIQYVPEEVERMNRIVSELLDYSREKPLQIKQENLGVIVQSVIGLFTRRIENEQIKVLLNLPFDIEILADRERIKQVLINLIINAIEAMAGKQKERCLTICANRKDTSVQLSIVDTGDGLPENTLNYLFQPFYTTKSQGIGLGLYLSQKIMREHNGEITVRSVDGIGCTFILHFEGGQNES